MNIDRAKELLQHHGWANLDDAVEAVIAAAAEGAADERERLALLAESRSDGWLSLTADEIRSGSL